MLYINPQCPYTLSSFRSSKETSTPTTLRKSRGLWRVQGCLVLRNCLHFVYEGREMERTWFDGQANAIGRGHSTCTAIHKDGHHKYEKFGRLDRLVLPAEHINSQFKCTCANRTQSLRSKTITLKIPRRRTKFHINETRFVSANPVSPSNRLARSFSYISLRYRLSFVIPGSSLYRGFSLLLTWKV